MSVYAVNKVCYRVVHEPVFRSQLALDAEAALRAADPPLTEDELLALLAGDVGTLSRMGANNFMLHNLGRFGVLGLDLTSFAERIRSEYREERERWQAEGWVP